MNSRAHHGFTPYRMRVDVAAAFCGEAVSTFKEKVAAGILPKPAWREGRAVYWRTADLILSMEEGAAALDGLKAKPVNVIDPDEIKLAGA